MKANPTILIEENYIRFYELMSQSPLITFTKTEQYCSVKSKTESPWPNLLFRLQLHDPVSLQLNVLTEKIQANLLSPFWLIEPSSLPQELPGILERSKFSLLIERIGMSMSLESFSETSVKDDLEIRDAKDQNSLKAWGDIAFKCRPTESKAFSELLMDLHSRFPNEIQFLLCYSDDLPVASCLLFPRNKVLGIYFVSTVIQYRKRGIGSHVMQIALQKGREMGCTTAVLQSTTMAYNLYKQLGFATHEKYPVYVFTEVPPK